MDVLISGAGIAGPTLAWWLLHDGHRVTIVEKAPAFRAGGYVIDFWGKGFDLAERMGLMPRLERVGYHVNEVRFIDREGRRMGGFDVSVLDRVTGGRFISLPRGELARALFEAVEDRVEAIFGDEIASLEEDRDGAKVWLASGQERFFDLVVGAEGIHSRTRELVFGPERRFECFLGYNFAAFTIDGYPRRDPDVYLMYGEPGRQAARFTLYGDSSLVLLIWRDPEGGPIPHDLAGQRALIRSRYAGAGWEVADFLAGLDAADDLYLDRVSQIRMDRWHDGPVALLGDAAYAPSFLAGQGSALAMIGGYVLAGELKRAGDDIPLALANYQRRLFHLMRSKQNGAMGMASTFVPKTDFGLRVRATAAKLLGIGWFADLVIGRSIRDQIDLPDYF
uniref:FAD-binding domain n=1 Tax=Altererythrobacter segetis TaxID=1104773 RepID=UPI00140B0248|nr:FAD-binding domain [Altererythrobacter segetis]